MSTTLCGHCDGEVTAEEKFKKLKSGELNRHVYYRCTKKIDLKCPEKYVNEPQLEALLEDFIAKNVDQIKVTDSLRANVERHYVVAESLADYYKVTMELAHPLVEYVRYVFTKGSFEEKNSLTKGIVERITIKNGNLSFSN